MAKALLVQWYNQMLDRRSDDQPQEALEKFRQKVAERYAEGTLQRLSTAPAAKVRRAAVLALGLTGMMTANETLAGRLRDDDAQVRRLAADALWALWFRGDAEAQCQELRRLLQLDDPDQALAGFNALVLNAPRFAEAYNQRAILYYRKKDYAHSLADCEKALQMNPYHFGALSGMAQCYLNLRKPKSALRAYRQALRINPNLDGVQEAIRKLEQALGEEERKDGK